MMRDISSDDFGQAFMTGLNNNIDNAEKAKYVGQISKFGEMFGAIPGVKKGDVLHLDWIPGSGTQTELNGKKIGEVLPDLGYLQRGAAHLAGRQAGRQLAQAGAARRRAVTQTLVSVPKGRD